MQWIISIHLSTFTSQYHSFVCMKRVTHFQVCTGGLATAEQTKTTLSNSLTTALSLSALLTALPFTNSFIETSGISAQTATRRHRNIKCSLKIIEGQNSIRRRNFCWSNLETSCTWDAKEYLCIMLSKINNPESFTKQIYWLVQITKTGTKFKMN